VGAFIKVWHPPFAPCDWKRERGDAMRVCAHLGIPFVTVDLEDTYKQDVIEYMLAEYAAGRTPNPDVMCNRHVKFGAFLDAALNAGADYIATGHHARVAYNAESDTYALRTGVDTQKDQSYFLWTLTQRQLSHTLFPVGDMQKRGVRTYAHALGLPTADKKDSQGLCFVGSIDMKSFLKRYLPATAGRVLSESGELIGSHDGAHFYTIGQRRGFRVHTHTSDMSPYYVIDKDVSSNTSTVSRAPSAAHTARTSAILENVHFIDARESFAGDVCVRYRYRQPLSRAHITYTPDKARVHFNSPLQNITPGQSIVFYDGDTCLGGAVISQ
jgi:tRNA-specific 2-thiouridylase